jgi:hypothetical protein
MVSREREALESNERLNELRKRHDKLVLLLEKMGEIEPKTEYEQIQKKYLRDYLKLAMKKLSGMIIVEESRIQVKLLDEDFQYLAKDMTPEVNTPTNHFVTAARHWANDK